MALIYGAYAVLALIALLAELAQGEPSRSGDDVAAFLILVGWSSAVLIVCSAALPGL